MSEWPGQGDVKSQKSKANERSKSLTLWSQKARGLQGSVTASRNGIQYIPALQIINTLRLTEQIACSLVRGTIELFSISSENQRLQMTWLMLRYSLTSTFITKKQLENVAHHYFTTQQLSQWLPRSHLMSQPTTSFLMSIAQSLQQKVIVSALGHVINNPAVMQ